MTTPCRGPERVQRGASPAPLPRGGPAAGTMRPVLGRPPRAPSSHPVKPGAQAPGLGKGTTASGKPTGAPRATGPDEARRTTRGHEARQRGRPPATTKAHGQVPSNNGRRVPQTRRVRTTRNQPRHENRCHATPAAVRMDECAPGSKPAPACLGTAVVGMDECAPGGYPAPAGYETAAVRMDQCEPGGYRAPSGYEQPPSGWTSVRPAAPPRTRNTRHNTPSEHTGEQEPRGQNTVRATQHTARAHR